MRRKILALLLATSMVFSMPVTSSAADYASQEMSGYSEDELSKTSDEVAKGASDEASKGASDEATTGASDEATTGASDESTEDVSTESSSEATSEAASENSSEAASEASSEAASEASSDEASLESSEESLTAAGEMLQDLRFSGNENDDRKEFKLSAISGTESAQTFFMYASKDGQTSVSLKSKADVCEYFGVQESDITDDNYKFEVVKKSGNTYIPAEEGEGPVELSMSGDESTNLCVMLKKKEVLPEETYYFRITVDFEVVPENLRVTVIPMINDPDTYCDTKEEAYAAVRSIIRNRTNNMARYHGATNNKKYDTEGYVYDRIYVSKEAFGGNDMDMYDVCDFDAERDGMLPYEGDYMYNLIGNRKQKAFGFEGPTIFDSSKNAGSFGSNDEILGDTVVEGKSYYIYEVYLPVITTKEEEDKVDAKVAELMETEFASVKDATNKEKIQKIYSYIINHVSGTVSGAGGSDRTYPLYHTAYHALIKGNGTCESFGQLFTRLSRELGVASKVIMGQDSSAHTYNIVDGGDGYWYYIDCSTKRGLSDSGHFYRSEEQERYTRPRFVINYLQKLKGGTNINVKTIKIIQDGVQVSEALTTREVSEYITANDAEGTSWTIHFDSDWTMELDSEFYFGGGIAKRVYIDLGGHTIKCKNSCDFSVNTIFGGNIQAGHSDKISSYSGNVIIHNGVRVKDVTFTSATSFDYVIFDLPGGTAESEPEEFYLDNVVFKKLRVMVTSLFIGTEYGADYSYRYNLNVETPVTFENCTFGMIDDSLHQGPAVTLSKGAKLIFNGTNTIGHVRYPQQEEGGDGFIYSPVNAIEFIPAGGNFGNGDILVTNNGTLKKITKTDRKGGASGAALSDIANYEKTNAHVAEGDEASLMVIGNDLTFAKPVFALSAEGSDIGAFVTWNDLGKWFSANGNTQTDYTVTLLENSVNPQSITFPSKAKSIKVTAKDLTGEKYVFGSTGNIKLVTDTEFVGLALKHAAKSAVLDLGGKKLTLTGTTSDMYDNGFMSVKGAGASTLVVGDDSFIQADTVTCSNIELLDGGKLCGYNGLTAASAELHGGSTLALRKTGTVTKLTVTETTEEKKAVFERIEDAILNIKTSYTCTAAGDKLSVMSKTVHGVLCRTEPGATVITTGIKEFPLDKLTALQPAGSEDYNTAIRTGNNISFACAWFELTADNAPEDSLGTYAKWSDVTAAIDKLGNSMMSYTVHVIRDANTMGKITMPKKASGLTVTGADENRVSLTFTGDISVTMPVKFKHLDLDNNDKKEPKLILGKHSVSFIDCSTVKDTRVFFFGSVSGKAGSTLIIDRAEATQRCTFGVSGSVNVGTLKVDGYQLDVYGALTSSALASFKSVRLTVSGNISFKDVISRDDNNEIIYGTDRKNTSFKIKGNVTALEEDETSDTSLDLEIEDKAGNRHIETSMLYPSKASITQTTGSIRIKKDLIAGAKVPACMIVVQRHMDQGVLKILYATKKVKKALRIAASAADRKRQTYICTMIEIYLIHSELLDQSSRL